MSIQEVVPERFAELFHHYQQAFAQDCHCGEERTSETWSHISAREKNRWIAAARLAL